MQLTLSIDNPNEETVENVLALLKHRSRHQRHRLNKHFKKFSMVEEAIQNKPSFGGLTQENWEELCQLFSDPKYQVSFLKVLKYFLRKSGYFLFN